MSFSEVAGQRVIIESLKNAIKNNMISNGYVFSGPEGCGKKLMAFIFAMALNCRAQAIEKPCGGCNSCIRTKSGNHPNVEVVKPTGQSIKIKQIRQIISDTAKKPFEAGYKIVIIDEAEKLTSDAQDAFLKTLEEPPENTLFILLAESHNLLLPTIVSRCQVFQFKPVDMKDMKAYIAAKYDYPEADIDAAIRNSKGIMGKALEFLQNRESLGTRTIYIDILDKALNGNGSEAVLMAAPVVDTREDAERLLEFYLVWFRDVLVYRESQGSNEQLFINIDNLERLTKHNSALTEGKLNSIMEIIKDTSRYVRHNVGIKNSIDGMLLNIAEVSLYNG